MKDKIKVTEYFKNAGKWEKELELLSSIALECGLVEEYKWRNPTYTHQNKNIALIGSTKKYCMISYFKGVLLKDKKNLLVAQTKNMQSERQIRFTNINEIKKLESTIKAYILEAIELDKSGIKVKMKETSEFEMPDELKTKFENDINFKTAFENLTPGRQRGYLLHFSQPKQSKTRSLRIEKYKDRILNGKGIRDCICGQSKRMPNCDGSHKNIS